MNRKEKNDRIEKHTRPLAVAIVGYGKMGRALEATIADTPDTQTVAIVGKTPEADVYAELSAIRATIDCLVDFSHHSNIDRVLRYAQENNKPLVMAVTGFNEAQQRQIASAAARIPIVYAQNMSTGVNVLKNVIAYVGRTLGEDFDIEIIEKHHNQKEDAPSGTTTYWLSAIDDSAAKHAVYGRKGLHRRAANEIGVHSVRGGTIVGEHTILFAGPDEIIELKHTALSKRVFAGGAVRAARFAVTQRPGLYGMDDVLRATDRMKTATNR
ncbi:MAG: 4-hydroxy-tetrahydrodipicolinate reductase [Prevotellaceae bacterium]|jgi:4-hydroxy-tetrahydrodipicolinate reductase|nr:4-hydroxy-tetrahydrodipicolinate reductase [Prevotellaceae bacterium]